MPHTQQPKILNSGAACMITCTLILTAVIFFSPAFGIAGDTAPKSAGPVPGKLSLDEAGALKLSPEDRCPVCAMGVARHTEFAAAIQLIDRTTYYFCGTGCMIRTWMNPDVYLGVDRGRLGNCVVQDYFTGAPIDGLSAFWVAGSDVMGPMGPALIPLKSEADRSAFVSRHGGKHLFRLSGMTNEKWEAVTGKKAVP